MPKQALILAAGNGSRIQRFGGDIPKPLRKVGGLSLIKRSILTAKQAGIRDFVIVVGYRGEDIVSALQNDDSLGVKLTFIKNDDYHKANGISVLKARDAIQGNFILMMADHLFEKKAIEKMLETPFRSNEVLLGIDYKLKEIFDEPDATKVKLDGEKVREIAKDLVDFDAYDTGLFYCRPKLFEVLENCYLKKGDVSLSEGMKALSLEDKFGVVDVSEYFWQDVDTPEALKHAEDILFERLRKPTDGWFSRNINRHISLFISRFLCKTSLSAHQVTALVTLVGVLSAYFVSSGVYWQVALGGFLFQMSSILDGCDGEMSKLKLSASKLGEWLDTASDNFTYFIFLLGVCTGLYRQTGSSFYVYESFFMLAGVLLTLGLMFLYLVRYTNSGSLVTIQKDIQKEEKQEARAFLKIFTKFGFVMKRDFFALFFMGLTFFNQLPLILHLSALGANVTWVFLVFFKKEIFKLDPAKVAVSSR
ncbi:MAG: NTP transferase domain-containing protein [Deltaproteobacteria bacterium]|nr:NTP transferase domain-containing protein [Deltaproteobacteria bacterium]